MTPGWCSRVDNGYVRLKVTEVSRVKVLRCRLTEDVFSVPVHEYVSQLIPEDFYSRVLSRRISYYTGRLMLASALAGFCGVRGLLETDICCSEHGKPYLTESFYLRTGIRKKIGFNITHSGNFLYMSFADAETSIDLEKIKLRKTMHDVAGKYYSPAENRVMAEAGEREAEWFFHFWTVRETLVKYSGNGLPDMNRFSFSVPAADSGDAESFDFAGKMDITPPEDCSVYRRDSVIATFLINEESAAGGEQYSLSLYLDSFSDLASVEFLNMRIPDATHAEPDFIRIPAPRSIQLVSRISGR